MQRTGNRAHLILAAALTLTLAAKQSAIAQQASETAVKLDAPACSEQSREVAFKTLVTIAPWLLARAERLAAIGAAERRAIFKSFAERELWRTGIPAGDGNEG
jgi:hypothetical protein